MADAGKIETAPDFEVDAESAFALRSIDSGCFALLVGRKVVFAVKDPALEFLLGEGFHPSVVFQFIAVRRDEFPSTCAAVFFDFSNGAKFRHEYFFSTESEKDSEIFSRLAESKSAEVCFVSPQNSPRISLAVRLNKTELRQLEAVS